VLRWPGRIVAGAVAIFAVCVVVGIPVIGRLGSGGLVDSSSPSWRADGILASELGVNPPNFIVLAQGEPGATPAALRVAGRAVAGGLRGVGGIENIRPVATGGARDTGRVVIVTAFIPASPRQGRLVAAGRRAVNAVPPSPRVRLLVAGSLLAAGELTQQIRSDFELGEAITFPITALALLWVFGSLWAAMIPLATGLLATAGALAVLRFVVAFTPVSIFALNLATGLSLALAIDYSLLLVSRYREERRGDDGTAVRRTLQTAGRTVLTSVATVAFSLMGLTAFPMYALRSFAYAGVAVVVFAAAAAVIVTPALLLLFGERIDRLDIRRVVRRGAGRRPGLAPVERSGWYRISGVAMRHAVPTALMVAAVLVLLGAPFLRARWGPADDRMLPPNAAARQVGDALRRQMASGPADLVTALVPLAPRAGRGPAAGRAWVRWPLKCRRSRASRGRWRPGVSTATAGASGRHQGGRCATGAGRT
jgi:RND superfamily putative drug exporter